MPVSAPTTRTLENEPDLGAITHAGEWSALVSDRFDRFLPFAGVLAGLLFFIALLLLWNDPSSETGPAATFSYWQNDRGQHQIVALLVAPLIAFLLLFFGAGLRRRLAQGSGDAGHGLVAFAGALLGAVTFGFILVPVWLITVGLWLSLTRDLRSAPARRRQRDVGAQSGAPPEASTSQE